MKKLLTLTLVAIIFLFSLTGCGTTSLGAKAQYWYEDEAVTGYKAINETIEYEVSVVKTTPSNSQEVKNEYVSMKIDKGTYVINLQTSVDDNGNDCYLYTTTLEIKGKYLSKDQEYEFLDNVTTSTKFYNIVKDFKPISSQKTSTCSTVIIPDENGYSLTQFAYEYNIKYDENTASTNYKLDVIGKDGTENLETRQVNYKDYLKTAFVDNELLTLIPRAYSYETGFTTYFSTLDVVSQKIQKMTYFGTSQNSQSDIKNFNLFYDLGEEKIGAENLQVAKVKIVIDDTFAGYPIEAYYITDHKTHRHRMAEAYTALNNNIGYLKYKIKKVTLK